MPKRITESTVTQSNALVMASYRLSLDEQRALLCCVSKMDPKKPLPKDNCVRVHVFEFAEAFKLSLENAATQLSSAANRFYERSIDRITTDGEIKQEIRWIYKKEQPVTYTSKAGYIDFFFTNDVAPHLSMLNNQSTTISLKQASDLKSQYSIRLLTFFSTEKKNKLYIDLNELKDMLRIEDLYPRFYDLKKRVLDPICKEISSKTALDVHWKQQKEGRRVRGVWFHISEKDQLSLFAEAKP